MKLEGKVAVVTGAASGMGKAIAELYGKNGAKVIVSDINIDGAEQVAAGILGNGGTAAAVKTDIAKQSDAEGLIDEAVNTFGTFDILVNNAGIIDNFEPVGDIEDALWEKVFAVNTTGVMQIMRKAVSVFLEKGKGSIINIAST